MVDVSGKGVTSRMARAVGSLYMSAETAHAIKNDQIEKGEVLAVARIAGIQAAKKCSDLIPLCHPLALSKVQVDFAWRQETVLEVQAMCKVNGQTGVEMEALTAVSVAALTIYDMCKAIDKAMHIEGIALLEKQGGKSGSWVRTT